MAKKPAPAPAVKKVRAYPFEGLLEIGPAKKPLEVLYLTKEGLIARVNAILVHVGEYHNISFTLPVIGHTVLTQVRVMKTYDKALDAKGKKVERMAEFRFEKPSEEHRGYVASFIAAIGQNK